MKPVCHKCASGDGGEPKCNQCTTTQRELVADEKAHPRTSA